MDFNTRMNYVPVRLCCSTAEPTFLRSRSSRRLASIVSPSISALVSTDRMWITSASVRSRVCRALAQCSCQ